MKNKGAEVFRALLLWMVVFFLLHGIVQVVVGVESSGGNGVNNYESFGLQKEFLAKQYLLLMLSRHLMPMIALIYLLTLGIEVVVRRSIPTKVVPMPTLSFNIIGGDAVMVGLFLLVASFLALVIECFVIYQSVEVYLAIQGRSSDS